MNHRQTITTFAGLCALAALCGCASTVATETPQDTAKFTLENTERFVVLDPAAGAVVSCTGLQERTLADGRLEVVANVKNRGGQPVEVSIQCVFIDDVGAPVGSERPWRPLALAGDATEVVRFTSPSAAAKRYTIRVRNAH